MTRNMRQDSGFTLFEVLIAVVILSFGLMAVAGLQVLGIRGNVDGEARSDASAILQAHLKDLTARRYVINVANASVNADALLTSTQSLVSASRGAGWAPDRKVNKSSKTKAELQAIPMPVDQENFPYTVTHRIVDVGTPGQIGSYKEVSVNVQWEDRSVAYGGVINNILIENLPLAPRYQ